MSSHIATAGDLSAHAKTVQLTAALLGDPSKANLDALVPSPRWDQIVRNSPEAKALLRHYRPAAAAFGKIFSTGFVAHCCPNRLVAQAAQVLRISLGNNKSVAEAHEAAVGYAAKEALRKYVACVVSSPVWVAHWQRWQELVSMEIALRSSMQFSTPKTLMLSGISSAALSSTQVLELLKRNVEARYLVGRVDLVKSAQSNRVLLHRLAALQEERSGFVAAQIQDPSLAINTWNPLSAIALPMQLCGNLLLFGTINFSSLQAPDGRHVEDVETLYELTKCAAIRPAKSSPDLDSGDVQRAVSEPPLNGMIDVLHDVNIELARIGIWKDLMEFQPKASGLDHSL